MSKSATAIALMAIALSFAASKALAQTIYKCTAEGQTVYQSQPCATAGKRVSLEPGPTPSEIQEAQRRAINDRNRADAADAAASERELKSKAAAKPSGPSRGNAGDCAALNRKYAEAWGRRNAYIRSGSSMPEQSLEDIEAAERNLKRAACKVE